MGASSFSLNIALISIVALLAALSNSDGLWAEDEPGSIEELEFVAMVLGCSSAPATLSLEQALIAQAKPKVLKEIDISFLKFMGSSLYSFRQREKLQV